MKSPFPGMDPFIEACGLWSSFHDSLIGDLERELANRVPEQYFVRLGARSYLLPDEEGAREFFAAAELAPLAESPRENARSGREIVRAENGDAGTADSDARSTRPGREGNFHRNPSGSSRTPDRDGH